MGSGMRKLGLVLLNVVTLIGAAGCAHQEKAVGAAAENTQSIWEENTAKEESCSNSNSSGTSEKSSNNGGSYSEEAGEKWTKQSVRSLFIKKNPNINWEIIDCVVATDFAYDRVGVVLFYDKEEESSNLAFMDAEGYYQTCGVYKKIWEDGGLSYLGNGVATFKLVSEENLPYTCKFSFSVEGCNVTFVAEDDLGKKE